MSLPNKVITFEDSILSKFSSVIKALRDSSNGMKVSVLYDHLNNDVENIAEFMEIMDSLYALGKIYYSAEGGVIKNVD